MITITVGDMVIYVESDEVEFEDDGYEYDEEGIACLLYTSPSPRDV
jgi:hypothetical protein